jgi:hypothetical protein
MEPRSSPSGSSAALQPPRLHGPVHGSGFGLCKRVPSSIISDARYLPTALHTELVVGIGFRFGWTVIPELGL